MTTLNPNQQNAVDTLLGPLVVIAGAGVGKTATMIARIDNLVANNINPKNILAITFTNKAASELRERLSDHSQDAHASTIHSLCVTILKRFLKDPMGIALKFTIMDPNDVTKMYSQLFEDIVEELEAKGIPFFDENTHVRKEPYVKKIATNISHAKNEGVGPDYYLQSTTTEMDEIREITSVVYKRAVEEANRMNAYDFDDLLIKSYELLKSNNTALSILQNQYQFIMVDEYQDTNAIQNNLINLIAEKYKNICVVGDPDQSIYGWRGAKVENILAFQTTYPDARLINLNQNYRSAQAILDTANDIIDYNKIKNFNRVSLQSGKDSPRKPLLYTLPDEKHEAEYVAKSIVHHHEKNNIDYKDCAILYRSHALNREIEHALQTHKIPYKISGGLSFYDRAEIKDIIAYLNVLANFAYDPSLKRIINTPSRGIGAKTIQALQDWANSQSLQQPLLMAAENVNEITEIPTSKKEVIHGFLDVYHNALKKNSTMVELVTYFISEFDYKNYLATSEQGEDKINNLDEFLSDANRFDTTHPTKDRNVWLESYSEDSVDKAIMQDTLQRLTEFLNNVATDKEANARDAEAVLKGHENDYVTLMTVHAAKGLEFENVYIVGLEDGNFPSGMSIKALTRNPHAIEEERRLMYVAVTRAKQYLTMTNVKQRYLYGSLHKNAPSRFLREIKADHIDKKEIKVSGNHGYKGSKPVTAMANPWMR